ncbi:MAG: sigma-70 family RNA polymerase sigma factor [Gemmatimonadota bacterium]|nr:MAG: sigma-70 family RNA polymerase sigma factor [Gemmatimonadota bacterium]
MSTVPARTRTRERDSDALSPALEQVLSQYSALIRQVGWRHRLSESDLDEVFQDVRIRLWRALRTGERIERAPASYIYRTALSAALDLIRRRRARREEEFDPLEERRAVADAARADHSMELSDLASQLAHTITTLRQPRRVVVRMHLAGYHRNEIAELLGWTEAKTRNLLYRGLADLRTRLLAHPSGKA